MKAIAGAFLALQVLAAVWLAAVARHGPQGLAGAALVYLGLAAGATWWASRRRRPALLLGVGLLSLVAAPGVLLALDALERASRERRVAATRVSDVRDEPILSPAGREIGIRLSFTVEVPSRAHYAFFPSVRSPDGAAADLPLIALDWTVDGRPPSGALAAGRHVMAFELYPALVLRVQDRRCRSANPVPPLPAPAPPSPLLVTINDTTYGATWRGGREERTRHPYSLAALYRGVLAEPLEPCPRPVGLLPWRPREDIMIQARKLGHVVLKVRDAGQSRDFYTRALGLRVAHEDPAQGTVFLSFGTQHHDLALFQVATGAPPAPAQPGLHHTAWQLGSFEELQAAHRELQRLGIPVEATVEHNVTRSVYFHDPDGNRVELYCDMVEDGFEAMRTLGPRRARLDIETGEAASAETRIIA